MHTSQSGVQHPEIKDLRLEADSIYIMLCCPACGKLFEYCQTTVAGVTIGLPVCPSCRLVGEIRPEDFEAALDRHLPVRSMDEMIEITNEATRLTETWYRVEPFTELLDYRGVNLGEGAERELISFILQGLSLARKAKSPNES